MNISALSLVLGLSHLALATSAWAQQPTPAADAAGTPAIQTGTEVAAVSAAEVWLALMDDGQYAKSWQAAASEMKKLRTEEEWTKLSTASRTPLGKVVFRKVVSTKFHRNPPNAPAGQYVVITYETSFEHRKKASEMVTPMLDKDGQWKVAGYFIK